jgi:beta-N-acetylhexosaminidase
MKPVIFGLEGLSLTRTERDFFKETRPFGFILFGRNIADRQQLQRLTNELRAVTGNDQLPILIDQEGGRVARLQGPQWVAYPPAATFGALYHRNREWGLEACALNYEALALDLAEVGISVTCAPVLDVPVVDAHDVIGDRAFSQDASSVAALGRACLAGLSAGGVEGVIKHIPGHGRSVVDSHLELPRVVADQTELERDLAPFKALNDASMAMTAHVIYETWDSQHCATLSKDVIGRVIRKIIGFDGLLMTDDLDMKALSGDIGDLAAQSQAAGCDVVLNCWGKMSDMESIVKKMRSPTSQTLTRMRRVTGCLARATSSVTINERQRALRVRRDALLAS